MKIRWVILCFAMAIGVGANVLISYLDGEVDQLGPTSGASSDQAGPAGNGESGQPIIVNADGSPYHRTGNASMNEQGNEDAVSDWNAEQTDGGDAGSEMGDSGDWGTSQPHTADFVGQRIE